ncbi:hypothetical protein ACT2CV_03495 [Pasteurellaceae bacterium 22721_9_1]
MKKLMAMGLVFFSAVALANEQKNEIQNAIEAKKPLAVLQIFDTSGKQRKLLEGNALSRSKMRELCVVVGNVEIKEQNTFHQFFKAPNAMELNIKGQANIQSSEDKKEHLVSFTIPKNAIQNNAVHQCWIFDKKDPIGNYTLEVQFNDTVFKGLSFRVLK